MLLCSAAHGFLYNHVQPPSVSAVVWKSNTNRRHCVMPSSPQPPPATFLLCQMRLLTPTPSDNYIGKFNWPHTSRPTVQCLHPICYKQHTNEWQNFYCLFLICGCRMDQGVESWYFLRNTRKKIGPTTLRVMTHFTLIQWRINHRAIQWGKPSPVLR